VVLNNLIKGSFSVVGAVTGFTLTKSFFPGQRVEIGLNLLLFMYILIALAFAYIFYLTAYKIIEVVMDLLGKLEVIIQKMTLYEFMVSAVGLVVGLVIANLITIPTNKINIIGIPLAIISNLLFGYLGIAIATGKKNEAIFDLNKDGKVQLKNNKSKPLSKLLDTSVIIDGRIVDICRAGFIEGELIVPGFVLEELRHIADSQDSLKRNKGRRGLDVLNILQKELDCPVRIENIDVLDGTEVDDMLLKTAKKFDYIVVTIDYNLSKVASFQGVQVLNINELANAMKPIALPGEEMVVKVIKDGKENGQGIGYLDDGTMIVVEGGRRHVGESVSVMVTSVLQTAAGRMIFAKPKYQIERVI
jgi:uncharacterized protein YacL